MHDSLNICFLRPPVTLNQASTIQNVSGCRHTLTRKGSEEKHAPPRKASGGNHRSNMEVKSYKENVKIKKMRKASDDVTYMYECVRPVLSQAGHRAARMLLSKGDARRLS